MINKKSDYVLHPPGGASALPGTEEANIYLRMPPDDIRQMLVAEKDPDEKQKMLSALKQWERQCGDYGDHPWIQNKYKCGKVIRQFRLVQAELYNPPINLPYYQDVEQPQGFDEIMDSMYGLHDQNDEQRFDYARQGERPSRDIDTAYGDFSSPSDGVLVQPPGSEVIVKDKGDGANPPDLEVDWPMGGPIDYLDQGDDH
jgi:hypothetical protein